MSNHTEEQFYFNLIKGKVAEQVFELMFRQSKRYTVIPFGYESIIPEVAQYVDNGLRNALFENIRNAPDFALVSHNPEQVYLVEVKYRSRMDSEEVRESARKICEKWRLAYLFVATPEGFYMDRCTEVMKDGKVKPLSIDWVPEPLQKQYLGFLDRFMGHR